MIKTETVKCLLQQPYLNRNDLPEEKTLEITPFKSTLSKHNLALIRKPTHTLQLNLGFLCNQTCRHCHLDAGPGRKENMDADTLEEVVAYAQRSHFEIVDITGGAPELNPHLTELIEKSLSIGTANYAAFNLSALKENMSRLIDSLKSHRVVIVASFPSLNVSRQILNGAKEFLKKALRYSKR